MVLPNNENTDVETKIRTERIIKVLNETILKIELAICLPAFFRDIDSYKSHFDENEYLVLTKCKEYECLEEVHSDESSDELKSENGEEVKLLSPNRSIINDKKFSVGEGAKDFEMMYDGPNIDPVEDPNIKRAMYIIWQRPDLVHLIKSKYLKLTKERPSCIFLENMHALKTCMHTRLMEDLSPEAEKKKVQFYKEIWKKNEEALVEIQTLKPKLETIMSRVEKELEEKDNLISEMLARMQTYESNFKEEIEKICTESEKAMIFDSKNSEIRQEVIRNDIESLEKTFQDTLDSNLKREKDLRTKRYKVESQLEACLEKYDNDMGERQAEFEELNAEYDEEKRLMNLLQEKFDEQEKEYIILMEEKALEEYLELERRIEDLRRRIAARIIQTHWRGLKQRRLERAKSKKARKGKGKKKGGEKVKSPKRPGSAGKKTGSPKNPGSAGKKK